jgi:starch-binding outer membrane protein, SusD/RagB family
MKKIINKKGAFLSLFVAVLLIVSACKDDFLNVPAPGALSEALLSNQAGVEGMLISAYGMLLGRTQGDRFGGPSNWVSGSIQGGDANKGSDAGDAAIINPIQRFEAGSTNGIPRFKWLVSYEGISRANTVLRNVGKAADMSAADKTRVTAEARFLRGVYYFELQKHFNKVPYIDEATAEPGKVKNSGAVWTQIEADFKAAYDALPETQGAAGRANKWAAGAFLGKTYLFQKKYSEAAAILETVIANGKTTNGKKYGLVANFADAFNALTENNEEHVFSVQAAAGTGTEQNAQPELVLNFTYTSPAVGCCGFFQPSIDASNSFRTDANGLPLLDGSYNSPANAIKNDQGVAAAAAFTLDAGNVDSRFDHTVGRRGVPYIDWGVHPGVAWVRDQADAGPYSPKKLMVSSAAYSSTTDGSSWTRGFTALNFPVMRYADVLLMAAEAQLEQASPNLAKAKDYINLVRARAAKAESLIAGNPANVKVGTYAALATQAEARTALRMERKLELSQEGHRFFDLVRWGTAADEMTKYLTFESAVLKSRFGGVKFVAGKNEYFPIPQNQIDLQGKDVLTQNPGY